MRHLTTYAPLNGTSDATFNLYLAASATDIGEPSDPNEAERVEWLSWARVREEIAAGRVHDGLSLTALLWALTFEIH